MAVKEKKKNQNPFNKIKGLVGKIQVWLFDKKYISNSFIILIKFVQCISDLGGQGRGEGHVGVSRWGR